MTTPRYFGNSFKELISCIFLFIALIGSNAILILDKPAYAIYRIYFVLFLYLLILYLAAKKSISTKVNSKLSVINILFYIFWTSYSLLTIFWAPDSSMALRYSIILISQITLMMIVFFITKDRIEDYIKFLIRVYIISLIIALLQIFGLVKISLAYSPEFENIGAFSLFGYNEFAYIITIFLPILFFYKVKKDKLSSLLVISISFFCLLYTGSVLGVISIFVEIILLAILGYNWRNLVYIGLLVLFILLSVLYVFPTYSSYLESTRVLEQFFTPFLLSKEYGFIYTSSRKDLALFDIKLIVNSFFLGVGAGGDSFYILSAGLPGNSHNWLLEILTNFGLLVFIPYIILNIKILVSLFKIFKSNTLSEDIKNLALGLFIGLLILPVNGMMSSSLLRQNSFWVYYGIIMAFCDKYQSSVE